MAAAEIAAAGRAATDPQPRPAAGHEDSLSLSAVVLYKDWIPGLRDAAMPRPNPGATAPRAGEAGVAAEPAKPAEAATP